MNDWKDEEIQRLENEIRQMKKEIQEENNYRWNRTKENNTYWQTSANSWDESFSKGISRALQEYREERALQKIDPSFEPFFGKWAQQLKAGREIYLEESEKTQSLIEDLLSNMRENIAKRIEEDPEGDIALADAMRENNFLYPVNW